MKIVYKLTLYLPTGYWLPLHSEMTEQSRVTGLPTPTPNTPLHVSRVQVRLPVQHRGPGDERQRPAALGHDLLRRDGVHLHQPRPQRDGDLRGDLGPEQAAGQPGQHPRADLPLQGDGGQLRHVPQSGREVPVWLVSGNNIKDLS